MKFFNKKNIPNESKGSKENDEMVNLVTQIQDKKNILDSLNVKLSNVRQEYEQAVASLVNIKKEFNKKIVEIRTLNSDHSTLVGNLKEAQKNLDIINTEYEKKSQIIIQLKNNQEDLEKINLEIEKQIMIEKEIKNRLTELKTELEQLESQKIKLNDNINTKSKYAVQINKDSELKIKQLNNKLSHLEKQKEHDEKNIQILKQDNLQLYKKLQISQNKPETIKPLDKKSLQLDSIIKQKHFDIQKLDNDIKNKKNNLSQITNQIIAFKKQLVLVQTESKTIIQHKPSLENDLRLLSEKITTMNKLIQQKQQKLDSLSNTDSINNDGVMQAARKIVEDANSKVESLAKELDNTKLLLEKERQKS